MAVNPRLILTYVAESRRIAQFLEDTEITSISLTSRPRWRYRRVISRPKMTYVAFEIIYFKLTPCASGKRGNVLSRSHLHMSTGKRMRSRLRQNI